MNNGVMLGQMWFYLMKIFGYMMKIIFHKRMELLRHTQLKELKPETIQTKYNFKFQETEKNLRFSQS